MPKPEYIAHLRANGATEDDIKALTEGSFAAAAIKSFDAAQASIAAEAARLKAESDAAIADYKKKADDWYETVAQPNLAKAQADATKSAAEAARLRALVVSSTDESLRKVAEEMGYKADGSAALKNEPSNPGNPGFDPNKYLTRDEILSIAAQEGEAIAIAQDIAFEHHQLFPDKPLNFRELRKEAVAAKKPVEQLWMERYGVPAAREARAAAATKANEDRIRKEERDKVTAELASQYGNPNMVPPSTSTNVFVPRPKAGREKAPWEAGLDGENGSGDRVSRAAKNFVERQGQRPS